MPCGKENVLLLIRVEYQASAGQGTAEVRPIAEPVFFCGGWDDVSHPSALYVARLLFLDCEAKW